MNKKIALLSFLSIIVSYSSALADFNKCTLDKTEKSVIKNKKNVFYVYIATYDKNKNIIPVGAGSAFVVDKKKGILATAKHLVYNNYINSKKKRLIFVRIESGKKVYFKQALWVFVSITHDIAIFRIKHKFKTQVLFKSSVISSGERSYYIGYPLPGPLYRANYFEEPVVSFGRFFKKLSPRLNSTLLFTNKLEVGASGSPIFDSCGKLTGVAIAMMRRKKHTTFFSVIVSYYHLLSILKLRKKLNLFYP